MTLKIIAEAAQGFLGDPPMKTKLLARMAAAAGADAVKFQLVYADEICTQDHKHFDLFRDLEMPNEEWAALSDLCRDLGIELYLDVFGPRSLTLADRLGAAGVKIHSTDAMNHALISAIAASGVLEVLLSVGGANAPEIERAMGLLAGKRVVLLHGFQGYPTETDENQIRRLTWLRDTFPGAPLGFGDHVASDRPERLWLSAVAVGAGATLIEKHLTMAAVMKEEDHEAAVGPDEFASFVANMRMAFDALGDVDPRAEDLGMSDREIAYRKVMKKHVVAAADLKKGAVLTAEVLTLKRTSNQGAVYYDLADVLGKTLLVDLMTDAPVEKGRVQ